MKDLNCSDSPTLIYQIKTLNIYFWFLVLLVGINLINIFADSVATKSRTITKVAEGVFVIRHQDSPDGNLNGNTTVIIGEKEVFVIDSCFQLSAAAEDIEQIRKWTDKPVRYLLNTHFHNDHNMGNGVYKANFPELEIIANSDTNRDMYRTPNTPSRFKQQITVREERLKTGKGVDGNPLSVNQIAEINRSLLGKKQVLEELKSFIYQPPTLIFDNKLNIDIGNREVQVLHLGRGTTSGDTIVYLAKEKILIAGDLLTHPILYTYDGYPSEWIETLEKMGQMEIDTLVPGHGVVLHDKNFLYLARDLLKSGVEQVHSQLRQLTVKVENPSLEEVRKGVDLTTFRRRFSAEDKETSEAFDEAADALVKIIYNEAMHNQ